jgi:hypothetical protein
MDRLHLRAAGDGATPEQFIRTETRAGETAMGLRGSSGPPLTRIQEKLSLAAKKTELSAVVPSPAPSLACGNTAGR